MLDHIKLTDTHKIHHPKATEYTFFSSAHGTLSKIDPMLHHKASLSNFKSNEIRSGSYPRLEINSMKKTKIHDCADVLSHSWLFATPWIVASQVPLSMEFSRQELLEWVAISFSRGIFLTQRLNLSLLCLQHCRQILYQCATWGAKERDKLPSLRLSTDSCHSIVHRWRGGWLAKSEHSRKLQCPQEIQFYLLHQWWAKAPLGWWEWIKWDLQAGRHGPHQSVCGLSHPTYSQRTGTGQGCPLGVPQEGAQDIPPCSAPLSDKHTLVQAQASSWGSVRPSQSFKVPLKWWVNQNSQELHFLY